MNLFRSNAFYLLSFFLVVIFTGALFLMIPGAWEGSSPISFTDAVFTATSAVCVAGLSTLNTADFSRFGHVVILLLMQTGGLGIISFSCILLTIPGNRLAITQRNAIQGFYLDGVEYRPRRIVRNIMLFTLAFEVLGTTLLAVLFHRAGIRDWLFAALFHAVSAFCNTGISIFANGLRPFSQNIPVMIVIMSLITLGGIGFLVLTDLIQVLGGRKKRLSYHSRVVLAMTGLLSIGAALCFLILERTRAYTGMDHATALVNALFQAINPRSGGFDLVSQNALTQPSRMLTCFLMLSGGAPGSIAGGIKITTVFVVLVVLTHKTDSKGDIKVFHHRLLAETIHKAVVYTLKAIALLVICIGMLTVIKGLFGESFESIVFEGVSAFGTVGLSLGLTSVLPLAGKWVIISAMFAGRVGLIALAFPGLLHRDCNITYPEGSIMLE